VSAVQVASVTSVLGCLRGQPAVLSSALALPSPRSATVWDLLARCPGDQARVCPCALSRWMATALSSWAEESGDQAKMVLVLRSAACPCCSPHALPRAASRPFHPSTGESERFVHQGGGQQLRHLRRSQTQIRGALKCHMGPVWSPCASGATTSSQVRTRARFGAPHLAPILAEFHQ